MEKKILMLVAPGLPYRKTLLYAIKRSRELGATISVLGITPEFDGTERAALALCEVQPYDALEKRYEHEATELLEGIVRFGLDCGVQLDSMLVRGKIEDIVRRVTASRRLELVVVPTPTTKTHPTVSFESLRHFAHSMTELELGCPVVSVLAT